MKDEPEFELQLLDAPEPYELREEREGITLEDLVATPEEAFQALQTTKGAAGLLDSFPDLGDFEAWLSTAYFTVCRKTGTARYLDLWDADHFDGVTDMQRCINNCYAWFSGQGYEAWGSGETTTGRINCYFDAPAAGRYVINVRLKSASSNQSAGVECLIDNSSYGPLTVLGTINQPHPANLGKGGHHFRIRQRWGSFYFLSLTVWRTG